MGQKTTRQQETIPGEQGADASTLMRLKMELVATREAVGAPAGHDTLRRMATAHPALAPELARFAAALTATSGYEQMTPTAATEALAERARARAFAAVFEAPTTVAADVAERVVATVRSLRRARGLSLALLARQLSVGADVLSALEAGLIRSASIPDRFVRALSEALAASMEAVRAALETAPVVRPALQRSRASSGEVTPRDFAEAIQLSPAMSAEQKARWLSES
ncbi:MAG TPA: helix-turn-helix transcriptional regulator [Steroidobacteraceae bacterium]|nr:helix-turn-helix transcriptional regulator [Steroidobacteraceae bacterium]